MLAPLTLKTATYQGSFINEQGIYSLFSFYDQINQGILSRWEDSETVEHYDVYDGKAWGIRLNRWEQSWLKACWGAAQRTNYTETVKQHVVWKKEPVGFLDVQQPTTKPPAFHIGARSRIG